MADDTSGTPHFPDDNDEGAPPAPRRRAAPRKTPARKSKSAVTRAEESVSRAATATKDAVGDAGERVARAVKPRSTKRAAPARATTTRGDRTAATETPKKPTKRTSTKAPSEKRRTSKPKSTLDRATDRVGGRWAAAAIAGVAAASTAALLSLRGSSARNLGTTKKPIDISGSGDKGKGHGVDVHGGTAHQPDGTDSSRSFQAGIADENTVPDKV